MARHDPSYDTNRASWNERAGIHLADETGFYEIDAFRAGKSSLHAIEAQEIGDVRAKRLAHLQCHIGLDTLSLARMGAEVTGLDFSSSALEGARKLATETGLPAAFVEGNVYDARELLTGQFDIVYVTWGAINWLPDIARWGEVAASLLAPGGFLYLAESHPFALVFEEIAGRLEPTYPWRTPRDRRVDGPLDLLRPRARGHEDRKLGEMLWNRAAIAQVLAHPQLRVERHLLGQVPEARPRRQRIIDDVVPADAGAAARGPQDTGEDAQRGGLAGPVLPQEPENLTRVSLEADPKERRPRARNVGLAQVRGGDHVSDPAVITCPLVAHRPHGGAGIAAIRVRSAANITLAYDFPISQSVHTCNLGRKEK